MTREERDCFAEPVLSSMRFFASLRMTVKRGIGFPNKNLKGERVT